MTVITELGSVDEDKRQARLQQLEEAESKRQEAWDKRREGQSCALAPTPPALDRPSSCSVGAFGLFSPDARTELMGST